jgi:nucleoside-diphosphate-sugar epimerase
MGEFAPLCLRAIFQAVNFSSSVKRIVVTSSTAAIEGDFHDQDARILSENDWNEQSIQEIKERGHDASSSAKYRASKTLAEKGK